jgi:dienelactone hydrolase
MRLVLVVAVLALIGTGAVAAEVVGPVTPPGLTAQYYAPAGAKRVPMVLVLGGSEGGLGGSGPLAKRLAGEGYGALALAYFGAEGVPKTLQSVPVEYFDQGIAWLLARPEAGRRRVAVLGGSKGGEAALLVAANNRRVCAVVAGAPSGVTWPGINPAAGRGDPGPSWTRDSRPVPYAPYDRTKPFKTILDLYERSLPAAPAESFIPVERIAGPVLLISGRQDSLWPSSAMADTMMARLDKAKFKHAHQHLAYPDAGHAGFGAPVSPDNPNLSHLADYGGTVAGNQAARADGWPKALAFLATAFKTGCR